MSPTPKAKSYWLGSEPYHPRHPLHGSISAGVAIVGGGLTGLWTAWYLTETAPELDVVVLEAESIGSGGSGRSGGIVSPWSTIGLSDLVAAIGAERALSMHNSLCAAAGEIENVCLRAGLGCDIDEVAQLVVATNPAQRTHIEADFATARDLGLDAVTFLDRDALSDRVVSPQFLCGVEFHPAYTLNPAKLVRGLAKALDDRDVAIYEDTPVDRVRKGHPARIATPAGSVDARQVVFALDAYSSGFRTMRSRQVPLYTYVVLTEPLTDAELESVAWLGRQTICDRRNFRRYFRLTRDNRILVGGPKPQYHFGSRVDEKYDRDDAAFAELESVFRTVFPQLDSVGFTHRWGGALSVTSTLVASFGTHDEGNAHWAYGFAGNGLVLSNLAGQVIAARCRGDETFGIELPFARSALPWLPPEPVRSGFVRSALNELAVQDESWDAGAPYDGEALLRRVGRVLG